MVLGTGVMIGAGIFALLVEKLLKLTPFKLQDHKKIHELKLSDYWGILFAFFQAGDKNALLMFFVFWVFSGIPEDNQVHSVCIYFID